MTTRRQESPFCIQIELTEDCPLRCSFCGLNGIREFKGRNYKFMEASTLSSIMHQIVLLKWNPRIEFAMHGEPSSHPDFIHMIRIARDIAPRLQLMMTSNGFGFVKDPVGTVRGIFEAGLNVLALDEYDGVNYVGKVREKVYHHLDNEDLIDPETGMLTDLLATIDFYDYPTEPRGNPHRRQKRGYRMVSFVQDITKAAKGTHNVITNHAGSGGPPLQEPLRQRCAKPFREIGIRWNGNMAMCCNDWRGIYKIGNVVTDGLEACWNGERMEAARHLLYAADRNFGACKGCDYRTYRDGLLPDKLGKETMSAPTKKHRATAAEACSGSPYATPVLRPWEKAT